MRASYLFFVANLVFTAVDVANFVWISMWLSNLPKLMVDLSGIHTFNKLIAIYSRSTWRERKKCEIIQTAQKFSIFECSSNMNTMY